MLRALLLAALTALAAAQEGTGTLTIDKINPNTSPRVFWLNTQTTRQIQYYITSGFVASTIKTLELISADTNVIASRAVGTLRGGILEFRANAPTAGFTYTAQPTAYFRLTDTLGGVKRHLFSSPTFALASGTVAVNQTITTNPSGQLVLTVDVTLSHPAFHSADDRIIVASYNGGDRTCYLSTGSATKASSAPAPKDRLSCAFTYNRVAAGQPSLAPYFIGLYVFADDTKSVASITPTSAQIAAWRAAGI